MSIWEQLNATLELEAVVPDPPQPGSSRKQLSAAISGEDSAQLNLPTDFRGRNFNMNNLAEIVDALEEGKLLLDNGEVIDLDFKFSFKA